MSWIHVPDKDPVTGETNLLRYDGVHGMDSWIADQCVPGMWVENRSSFIRLNDDIARWLALRVDGYKVTNPKCKKDDFFHPGSGLDVWIDDPKVAILFKLTYGGAKVLVS